MRRSGPLRGQQYEPVDDEEHVVLGNGVVPLVVRLHLQRLRAVGLEEQIALRKD